MEKNENIIVTLIVLFTEFPISTAQVGSVTCKTYNLSMYYFSSFRSNFRSWASYLTCGKLYSCEHSDEPSGSLKLLGISWMAAQLAASQEGLSSVSK
jgi:hypothetical protein